MILMKKIIIVDDYVRNLRLYKAILNDIPDVDILTEEDGIKGLEIIKSSNPDLIILDYKLTNINGILMCKELRKINKFKDVPIIAVSSSPLEKDIDRETAFKEAGFDLSFSKPIKALEFREIVRGLLFE